MTFFPWFLAVLRFHFLPVFQRRNRKLSLLQLGSERVWVKVKSSPEFVEPLLCTPPQRHCHRCSNYSIHPSILAASVCVRILFFRKRHWKFCVMKVVHQSLTLFFSGVSFFNHVLCSKARHQPNNDFAMKGFLMPLFVNGNLLHLLFCTCFVCG